MIEGIFSFWTDDNPMPPNRAKCYESMDALGLPHYLVTPDNLKEYEVTPFHPVYELLTLTHRSDYLRIYFMFHFGGGYSDVKFIDTSWVDIFKELKDSDKWAVMYRELPHHLAPCNNDDDFFLINANYKDVGGMSAFIMKKGTPLINELYKRQNELLDLKYYDLIRSQKGEGDYPIRWLGLMADIGHPLSVKYKEHILLDERIKPNFDIWYR